MATVKRTSGDYIIQTPYKTGADSNITLDTDNVYITGNLTIAGDTFHANVTNSDITDRLIVLNYGETGNGVANVSGISGTSGIVIDRGIAPGGNVRLIWNESTSTWQVSGMSPGAPGDGSQYLNIATTSGGTAISAVVEDLFPVLGGNLNVQSRTIYANVIANTYVTIQGVMSIINANITPLSNAGTTVFYANTAGAGTAGLYVVNDQATNEELITKRRAFGFSLIL
jgi:hypothetical protein